MYNEHFGLDQPPFRITPDTRLFYTGGGRGDVLEALVYAITSGEGIIKVTGEVGTGKTMLCRMLESRLPDNVDLVYLANPSLSPDDIVQAIALELGVLPEGGHNRIELVFQLQQTLVQRHADNYRVVVLVEEAQSMPIATLEEVRLLSNLETKREKLLQIVLFGQPELDEKLAQPEIRQLRERITHSFNLAPLAPGEIRDYVNFRLRSSGYRGRDAFAPDACRAISRASEGLTRRVNILADKALLAAYADDTHDVARRHVKVAIKDSAFQSVSRHRPGPVTIIAGVALLAAGLGFFGARLTGPGDAAQSESTTVAHAGGAMGAQAPLRSAGASESGVPKRQPASAVGADPQPSDDISHTSAPMAASDQAAADAVQASTESLPLAVAPPALVTETVAAVPSASPSAPPAGADAPVVVAAMSTSQAVAVMSEAAAMPPPPSTPPPAATPPARSLASDVVPAATSVLAAASPTAATPPPTAPVDLLEQRLAATQAWLGVSDPGHYTVQLLATVATERRSLIQFLERQDQRGELGMVYVYQTRIGGRPWYSVVFGNFASYSAARSALKALPRDLARHRPFIRNIRDLRARG